MKIYFSKGEESSWEESMEAPVLQCWVNCPSLILNGASRPNKFIVML